MKCKKLTIETNGIAADTKVFIDGEQLPLVQRLQLAVNLNDLFVHLSLEQATLDQNGKVVTKEVPIRDEKTQKIASKPKVVTEPLVVEFEK